MSDNTVSPTSANTPKRRRFDWLAYLLIAAIIAIPLVVIVLRQQRMVVPVEAWVSDVDEQGRVRPLAEVMTVAREMKLITMSVSSTVRATVTDARWRGTASATVEAPVKYSFGVDLSELEPEAFRYDFISQRYLITLPPPKMLAAEVDGSHPIREVIEVSGTRFKSLAGRDQLVLAQKAIYDEARRQSLPKKQREEIRSATREQVAMMIERFVGPKYQVKVTYSDD
jgi:hypothetical protein